MSQWHCSNVNAKTNRIWKNTQRVSMTLSWKYQICVSSRYHWEQHQVRVWRFKRILMICLSRHEKSHDDSSIVSREYAKSTTTWLSFWGRSQDWIDRFLEDMLRILRRYYRLRTKSELNRWVSRRYSETFLIFSWDSFENPRE